MTPEDPPDAQRRFREGAPGVPRVDILEKVTVKKIVFLMRIFWAWNRGGEEGGEFFKPLPDITLISHKVLKGSYN